jgi:hypothetical protein
MDWTQALDIVAGDHHRFRELCADDNPDVAEREAYRALMVRQATGEAPPAPTRQAVPVRDSIRATRLGFRRCWFSTKDSACGC